MGLIKLLIIDYDDEYSFNLCNYLTLNYSDIFLVNYCCNACNIKAWIDKIEPDIVIIAGEYYSNIIDYFREIIIVLGDGTDGTGLKEVPVVYKYRDANQIAKEIINIYTKAGNFINKTKEKIIKTIAVYSAGGNVGKTAISYGISLICSYSGLSVFYLSLEQFQSTSMLFSNNIDCSISEIIYYSKERDKNLSSKITTMSCKDAATNISYFGPPDNIFEISELLPEDMEFLISAMKSCGQYDLIVIDMDSQLSGNSVRVFEMADEIIYIFNNDEICLHKTDVFIKNMELLSKCSSNNISLINKLVFIENKVIKQALLSESESFHKKVLSKIPFQPNLLSLKMLVKKKGGPELLNSALKEIAGRYIL